MNRERKNPDQRPDVFSYHDYREFLRAYFDYRKSEEPRFSLRSLALKSELSVGYLPMVLSGQRLLSDGALKKLEPHLLLEKPELKMLSYLRDLSDSENQEERKKAYQKIKRFARYQNKHVSELEAHKYLSSWYIVAIRELAHLPNFQLNPKWIQRKLKRRVPLPKIKQAIEFLLTHHYLEKGDQGQIKAPNKPISCYHGVYKLAMSDFHKQMLKLAAESIYETPSQKRNLVTHTIAIPETKFQAIKEIMDEALTKIQNLSQDISSADSVYQVSLLSFPLTQPDGENS